MIRFLLGLWMVTLGLHAVAAPTSVPPLTPATTDPVLDPAPLPRMQGPQSTTSRDLRAFTPVTLLAELTTASLVVPLKYGGTLAWNYTPAWSFEVSYLTGSLNAGVAGVDIAKYSERSYQLLARYFGDHRSFNMIFGVSQETGTFNIGNKYLNYVSGAGSIDLAQLQAYAVTFGFGQRWQWKNGFTVGVDYLTATVPIQVGNKSSDYFTSNASQSDKNQVSDTLNILARIPRVAIFTLTAGYSF